MIDPGGYSVVGPTDEELERLREQYLDDPSGDGSNSSETGGESHPSPTHGCQACGEEVREQTPFTTLELWCGSCDTIRWFRRL